MRVSDNPLVYLIDTPGISLPNIKNLEMGMKLAACGNIYTFMIFFHLHTNFDIYLFI